MNKLKVSKEKPGHFIVDGDMTFSGIDKKTLKLFDFLTASKQVTLDLGGVGNADSAGLALMIEWIKITRSKRVQLRFRNIPEQLLNVAKMSGLDKMSYFMPDAVTQVSADRPT